MTLFSSAIRKKFCICFVGIQVSLTEEMRCFANFCGYSKSVSCKRSLFRFPRNKKLRRKWLLFCGVSPELEISDDTRLCSAHFAIEDTVWKSDGKILYRRKNATPTIRAARVEEDILELLPKIHTAEECSVPVVPMNDGCPGNVPEYLPEMNTADECTVPMNSYPTEEWLDDEWVEFSTWNSQITELREQIT